VMSQADRAGKATKRVGRPEDATPFSSCTSNRAEILETEGKDIVFVTHGRGLSWDPVTVTGKGCTHRITPDAHAPRTPGLGMARNAEP